MAKSKKQILTFSGLLVILVIFPLLSLYYLNSGINFRLNIENQLLPKDTIENVNIRLFPDSNIVPIKEALKDKLVLFIRGNSEIPTVITDTSRLYLALDQFENRSDLLILYDENSLSRKDISGLLALTGNSEIELGSTINNDLYKLWPDSIKNTFALAMINENAAVLNFYNLQSGDIMSSLIEHIAVSLPQLYEKHYDKSDQEI